MKKILGILVLSLLLIPPVFAKTNQELRQELLLREKNKNIVKEEIKASREGILNKIKDRLKNFKFGARIIAELNSKDGNILNVTSKEGISYKVNVTSNTKLKRKYWGKSSLDEFQIGNVLNIFGKWTDDTKTAIDAMLIRNTSIQRRWGAFFGDVVSKSDSSFVIKSVGRGTQTVLIDTTKTKLIDRTEKIINYSDIQVGHRVRIKGVWDKDQNKIFETEEIKDFTIPVIKPSINPD